MGLDLDPRGTALLVIDMQNDFCSPGGFFEQAGLDLSPGKRIVEPIAELSACARSLELPVIYTKSVRPDPLAQRLKPSRVFYRAPKTKLFEPGSWGVEIIDALTPEEDDIVLEKPRYSAFHATSLEDDLRARGVDTVVLTGTTTNCCIDSTMRDAFFRNFNVVVVSDCVAGFGGEERLHEGALENARLLFGVVASGNEVVEALGATVAADPSA